MMNNETDNLLSEMISNPNKYCTEITWCSWHDTKMTFIEYINDYCKTNKFIAKLYIYNSSKSDGKPPTRIYDIDILDNVDEIYTIIKKYDNITEWYNENINKYDNPNEWPVNNTLNHIQIIISRKQFNKKYILDTLLDITTCLINSIDT